MRRRILQVARRLDVSEPHEQGDPVVAFTDEPRLPLRPVVSIELEQPVRLQDHDRSRLDRRPAVDVLCPLDRALHREAALCGLDQPPVVAALPQFDEHQHPAVVVWLRPEFQLPVEAVLYARAQALQAEVAW